MENVISEISDLLVFLLENTEIDDNENSKSVKYDKLKNKKLIDIGDKDENKDVKSIKIDDNKYINNINNNINNKNNKKNDENNDNTITDQSNKIHSFTKLILGIQGLGLHATQQHSNGQENNDIIGKSERSTYANLDENKTYLDLQINRIFQAMLYKNEKHNDSFMKMNKSYNKNNNDKDSNDNNKKDKLKVIDDKNSVRELGLKYGFESGVYLHGILIGLSGIFGPSSECILDDNDGFSSSSSSSSSSSRTPSSFSSPTLVSPSSPPTSSSLPSPPSSPSSPLPSYITRQLLLSTHRYCTQDWNTPHTLTKIITLLTKLSIWHQISNTQLADTISYYKRNLDLIQNNNDIIKLLSILPHFISYKNNLSLTLLNSNDNKLFLSNEISQKSKHEMKFIIENLIQKILIDNITNDEKVEIKYKEKSDTNNYDKNGVDKNNYFLIIETIKSFYLTDKILEDNDELNSDNNNDDNDNRNKNEMKSNSIITSPNKINVEITAVPIITKSLKNTGKEIIPSNLKRALMNGFSHTFHGFQDTEILSILQFFPTVNIFWSDLMIENGKDKNGDLESENGKEKLSTTQLRILGINNGENNENSNMKIIDKIFTNFGVPMDLVKIKNGNKNDENKENSVKIIEKSMESITNAKSVNQHISPKYPLFPLWETLEELRESVPVLESCPNYIPNVLWQCHKKKITIQTLMVSSLYFAYIVIY